MQGLSFAFVRSVQKDNRSKRHFIGKHLFCPTRSRRLQLRLLPDGRPRAHRQLQLFELFSRFGHRKRRNLTEIGTQRLLLQAAATDLIGFLPLRLWCLSDLSVELDCFGVSVVGLVFCLSCFRWRVKFCFWFGALAFCLRSWSFVLLSNYGSFLFWSLLLPSLNWNLLVVFTIWNRSFFIIRFAPPTISDMVFGICYLWGFGCSITRYLYAENQSPVYL